MSTPISVSGGGMLDKAGSSPLISVKDLAVSFPSEAGRVDAVRGVSFDIARGETLGIVGESGSGKSVTSTAIMGLLPSYAKVDGSITLEGEELLGRTDKEMSKVRGKRIGMVFQDPLSALTPIFTVGDQIVEAILIHPGRRRRSGRPCRRHVRRPPHRDGDGGRRLRRTADAVHDRPARGRAPRRRDGA